MAGAVARSSFRAVGPTRERYSSKLRSIHAVFSLRRRRLRVSALRFSEPGPAPLSPGLTTLAGTVETDEPEGVAIRFAAPYRNFALDPTGGPRWGIYGEAAERSSEVCPFTLVVAGTGARVRVKPEEDVNLLSWPERVEPEPEPAGDSPRYALTLRAGERVLVSGMLARTSPSGAGYRGDQHDFVLHAPRGGSLGIETESFAVRLARAPRVLRRFWDAIFAAAALVHVVLVLVYWVGTPLPHGMFASAMVVGLVGLAGGSVWLHVRQEPARP